MLTLYEYIYKWTTLKWYLSHSIAHILFHSVSLFLFLIYFCIWVQLNHIVYFKTENRVYRSIKVMKLILNHDTNVRYLSICVLYTRNTRVFGVLYMYRIYMWKWQNLWSHIYMSLLKDNAYYINQLIIVNCVRHISDDVGNSHWMLRLQFV